VTINAIKKSQAEQFAGWIEALRKPADISRNDFAFIFRIYPKIPEVPILQSRKTEWFVMAIKCMPIMNLIA
jgi:hypothetical protein